LLVQIPLYSLYTIVLERHFKVLIQFRPIFNLFRIRTQVSRSCNIFLAVFYSPNVVSRGLLIFAPCSAPLVGSFPSTHFLFHSLILFGNSRIPTLFLQASQTYANSLRTPFCHLTAFSAAFYPRARPRATFELSTYMRIRLIGSNYAGLHSR
jgi:hypothetical protein